MVIHFHTHTLVFFSHLFSSRERMCSCVARVYGLLLLLQGYLLFEAEYCVLMLPSTCNYGNQSFLCVWPSFCDSHCITIVPRLCSSIILLSLSLSASPISKNIYAALRAGSPRAAEPSAMCVVRVLRSWWNKVIRTVLSGMNFVAILRRSAILCVLMQNFVPIMPTMNESLRWFSVFMRPKGNLLLAHCSIIRSAFHIVFMFGSLFLFRESSRFFRVEFMFFSHSFQEISHGLHVFFTPISHFFHIHFRKFHTDFTYVHTNFMVFLPFFACFWGILLFWAEKGTFWQDWMRTIHDYPWLMMTFLVLAMTTDDFSWLSLHCIGLIMTFCDFSCTGYDFSWLCR